MTAALKLIRSEPEVAYPLTQVEVHYIEGQKNYRILFGKPVKVETKEYGFREITRKLVYFRPGDIFALDLWERNQYGTSNWSVYVLQAAYPGESAFTVPQVKPAVKILLEAVGPHRAKAALKALKEIEERTDPTQLAPARYLLTDFRLKDTKPRSKRFS